MDGISAGAKEIPLETAGFFTFFSIFAAMKRICLIGVLFCMAFLYACHTQTTKFAELDETPIPELAAIDRLMWQQPDSALAVLLDFAASPAADSLDAFNGHYTQLLASELLYKNDYQQSNRAELLQAVAYFDSLMMLSETHGVSPRANPHTQRRHCGLDPQSLTWDNIIFLDARAHYINGVGFYERDSVVEACGEYLEALETMEEHFQDKDLVGRKAQFMTYTYNRLGDMFSEQFMMESSIRCYEQALEYCLIEPTSPTGVPNTLYRLGKQYDKMDMVDKARQYYCQALEMIPNTDNLVYRNILSSKAICDYQLGLGIEQSLVMLRQVLSKTTDEKEQSVRLLIIGCVFFEERMYDSAIYYLEPICENGKDEASQIEAANYLHIIYDSLGDKEKATYYMRLSAYQRKTEGQNKALVSQLDHLFQNHENHNQEKEAKQEQRNAVLRTIKMVIPIVIIAVSIIIVLIRKRNNKKLADQHIQAQLKLEEKEEQHIEELNRQQKESNQRLHESETMFVKKIEAEQQRHEKTMEAERQAHRMEQAALSGRLKRSNEKLRDVSKQLEETLAKNSLSETETSDDYSAYINAPICLYIVNLVHRQQFKSKMDYLVYKDDALGKEQLLALRDAAEKHLARFNSHIRKRFPNLTDNDMDYCYLFLLGLGEADVSALMQRAYTTVCDRSRKISRIIGASDSLYQALRNMLYEN